MNKPIIYCLDLHNEDFNKIKSLGYRAVGLGKDNYSSEWLKDDTGINIAKKNKFYGEYTFHYWFWKNELKNMNDNQWIGFCAYRRFWTKDESLFQIKDRKDFLTEIPNEFDKYDVILGDNIYMNGRTPMKLIKHAWKSILLEPKYINKKNRNLKFHFDSFHGYGNLEKAIDLLEPEDKKDFKMFTENQNYYNRGNMFICKSKKIFNSYYKTVFTWMKKCEDIFGLDDNNKHYGKIRIYGFLLERFSSYWFNKYTKVKVCPIAFFDINKSTDL